jgi:hypothetical protein
MQGCKKSVRNRVGVHKAEDTSVRDISQIRESHAGIIHRDNSPAGRTWLDRARGNGRRRLSQSQQANTAAYLNLIGNWNDLASIIEPEFDEVESPANSNPNLIMDVAA